MKAYTFELTPDNSRKSFYGKARVTHYSDGLTVLRSYNTDVCMITPAGEFVRLWSGYSATTMRHVNAFLTTYSLPGGGKAWWNAQPVQEDKPSTAGRTLTNAESYAAMIARRIAG